MKNFKNYLIVFALVIFYSCDQQSEVTPELDAPSAANLAKGDAGTARAACDNDMVFDVAECGFTSGEHTLSGDLMGEYETLLNACFMEPLPANCNWAGYQTDYEYFYYNLDWCCYGFNAHNFKLGQIKSIAQSHAPSSDWLITSYEVGFASYPPRFHIKANYRKKGICSLPADKVDFVQ